MSATRRNALPDLTGKRFGRLLVIERNEHTKHNGWLYRCQCDCGTSRIIRASSLCKTRGTRSCGCLSIETLKRHSRRINMEGHVFGRLTVLSRVGASSRKALWLCECTCGNRTTVSGGNLRAGQTSSCGCLHAENLTDYNKKHTKHGFANRSEYRAWQGAIQRCTNPRAGGYQDYGGRGISICERWHKFEHFIADMGVKPTPQHSIDRIDNDGNYEPGNCRWATPIEQARNRRRNGRKPTIIVTFRDQQHYLVALCRDFGIALNTVKSRLLKGWNLEDALTTAPRPQRPTVRGQRVSPASKSDDLGWPNAC